MQHLFGLICEPSTADLGAASWIASLAATRASPSVSPVLAEGLTTPATCGLILPALSAKSDPGDASSKTSPGTSRWDSMRSARTYSRWAIALRLEYSQRPKPELPTEGNGCSSWPTASVADSRNSRNSTAGRTSPNSEHSVGDTLCDAIVTRWASPRTSDTNGIGLHGDGGMDLRTQASMWGTPRASDGEKGGPNQSFGAGGVPLPAMAVEFQASAWPTPAARDSKGANSEDHVTTNGTGRMHMDQLPNFVAHGSHLAHPAPTTPAGPQSLRPLLSLYLRLRAMPAGAVRSEMRAMLRMAIRRRASRPGWARQTPSAPYVRPSFKRSLNPCFVELLMMLPAGWTDCDCPATAFTPWQRRARGLLSMLLSPPTPPAQGLLL